MTQPPGPMPERHLRGAIDLSGLQGPSGASSQPSAQPGTGTPAAPGGAAGVPSLVIDVTEANFAQVVELSMTVPVVVDLWAQWCNPCKQLTPVLTEVVESHGGKLVLAKVDVDANPQISQAFNVQSIPTVMAILKGQPVPLFQGAYPKPQVEQVFAELLRVAAENGVTGSVSVADQPPVDAEPAEPQLPPLHQKAFDAIDAGDFDAAASAYEQALAENPGDSVASAGLAQVHLLQRTANLDPTAVRSAAADNPTDVQAQCAAADLDVVGGHIEDGFTRLIDLVRATSGDERELARTRLIELFSVVGDDDALVLAARRCLANALF